MSAPEPGLRQVTLDLLRHGAVAGPPALYGRHDVPLSPLGWQQLEAALQAAPRYQRILSSPLRRCADFARLLAEKQGLVCELQPALAEMDFGHWDGVPFDDLESDWPRLEQFWQQPARISPPAGETLQAFHDRIAGAWQHLLGSLTQERVLLLTHAGVIRLILAQLLPIDWRAGDYHQRLRLGHASLTRIQLTYAAASVAAASSPLMVQVCAIGIPPGASTT